MACSIVSRVAGLKWSVGTGDAIKLPLKPQNGWYIPASSRRYCSPYSERSEDGHEQSLVTLGEKTIPVDREIAPLIQALNDAGVHTLTSCRDGYAMFFEADWRNLCALWRRNEGVIGAPVPTRTVAHPRDTEWAEWMQIHYPPHFPIRFDRAGMVTTVCWLFDPDEVQEVMPTLVRALDGAARDRCG